MDSKKQRQENEKKWWQIVAKAWMDPHFKKELLAHPEKIMREYEIDLHGKRAKIMENSSSEIYFVLPTKPSDLSEMDLKNINAAKLSCGFTN